MKKYLLVAALAAMIAAPAVSSAAVNIQFSGFTVNGKQSDTVRAGSTVRFGIVMDATNPDEVEYVRTTLYDIDGNQVQGPSCYKLTSRLVNKNDVLVTPSVRLVSDLPDQEILPVFETFGIPGLPNSDGCDDNNLNSSTSLNDFDGRLFVDADSRLVNADEVVGGTTGTGNVGGTTDETPSWLKSIMEQLTALMALLSKPTTTPPAPTKPCPPVGVSTTDMQKWLIANDYSIPAIQNGTAGYGYWGSQTTHAYNAAMSACR